MLKFDKFILESEQFEVNEDLKILIGNYLEQLILKNKILSENYLNTENLEDEEWRRDWEIGDEESDHFKLLFYFNNVSDMDMNIDKDLFKRIDFFKSFLKELQKEFAGLELKHEGVPNDYCSQITVTIYHKNIKTNKVLNNLFKSSKGITKFNL